MSIRKHYRELMKRGGGIFTPGAYDALSARILEMHGFEAVNAGGYSTIGALLGQPDTGQSNMRDVSDNYARICAAVEIPVYTDADTGFGGVNNVRQMVRSFERAGVAGLFFSDQVFPNRCGFMKGKQVIPIEQMIAKIKSALDARRDQDLFLTARTDALAVEGLDAAIERAQIYKELGVDMAKINGTNNIDEYKRIRREVPGPQTATMSEANDNPKVTVAEFKEAGAEMISFPSSALFASALGISRVAEALQRDGSLINVREHILKLPDYYKIVRLKDQQEQEERYEAEAEAIMKRRRMAAE
jgi:2-methylisocitrate lyase-like PEP mutase family enzyme